VAFLRVPLKRLAVLAALSGLVLPGTARADELGLRGTITPEIRVFPQDPSGAKQTNSDLSVSAEVTAKYFFGAGGNQSIVVTPFGRLDQRDHNRTHWDLREARYGLVAGAWEMRIGFDKVFWGVTEAVHLVDVINQADLIEDPIKQEVRLGQPMVRLRTTQSFGTFDFFLLPYFRERTYPSINGRPATDIPVASDLATYESSRKARHVDAAMRYSNAFGDIDLGLSYFQGTGRDPILQPALDASGSLVLAPFYAQIKQGSFDVQATKGAWLFKAEGYWRDELNQQYETATGGIEYTFYGIAGNEGDLGVVAEYALDSRGMVARAPYQNDGFLALRWTANDAASTSLLAGIVVDASTGARGFRFKGERRLDEDYHLSVEAYAFGDVPKSDPVYSVADDDYLQIRLARYF
tara:strand:+ start:2347 stop:3570 length:1224 start_codon:yes stop_codon:yes gene_type:complete